MKWKLYLSNFIIYEYKITIMPNSMYLGIVLYERYIRCRFWLIFIKKLAEVSWFFSISATISVTTESRWTELKSSRFYMTKSMYCSINENLFDALIINFCFCDGHSPLLAQKSITLTFTSLSFWHYFTLAGEVRLQRTALLVRGWQIQIASGLEVEPR